VYGREGPALRLGRILPATSLGGERQGAGLSS